MVLGNPGLTWADLAAFARAIGFSSLEAALAGYRICDCCGDLYPPRRIDQKYCNDGCGNRHRRALRMDREMG